jgi:hypothetical protein
MTEEQRKLCRDLVIFPNGQSVTHFFNIVLLAELLS